MSSSAGWGVAASAAGLAAAFGTSILHVTDPGYGLWCKPWLLPDWLDEDAFSAFNRTRGAQGAQLGSNRKAGLMAVWGGAGGALVGLAVGSVVSGRIVGSAREASRGAFVAASAAVLAPTLIFGSAASLVAPEWCLQFEREDAKVANKAFLYYHDSVVYRRRKQAVISTETSSPSSD